jgi:hypothetical protein
MSDSARLAEIARNSSDEAVRRIATRKMAHRPESTDVAPGEATI